MAWLGVIFLRVGRSNMNSPKQPRQNQHTRADRALKKAQGKLTEKKGRRNARFAISSPTHASLTARSTVMHKGSTSHLVTSSRPRGLLSKLSQAGAYVDIERIVLIECNDR